MTDKFHHDKYLVRSQEKQAKWFFSKVNKAKSKTALNDNHSQEFILLLNLVWWRKVDMVKVISNIFHEKSVCRKLFEYLWLKAKSHYKNIHFNHEWKKNWRAKNQFILC